MSEMSHAEYMRFYNKARLLPEQLARARKRVKQLEAEAERYGMKELLRNPERIDQAWDREVELAKIRAREA